MSCDKIEYDIYDMYLFEDIEDIEDIYNIYFNLENLYIYLNDEYKNDVSEMRDLMEIVNKNDVSEMSDLMEIVKKNDIIPGYYMEMSY